jgi:hypothetical protein
METGDHFKNGTSPKRLTSSVNHCGLLILFLSLFCIQSFGQEAPVIIQYRIISDEAQIYTMPGHEDSEVIGNLQKGQLVPVDSLQLDNSGYLPIVIDYLDVDWAKKMCKEYHDSEDYTGDLWYAYVKSVCVEKVKPIVKPEITEKVKTTVKPEITKKEIPTVKPEIKEKEKKDKTENLSTRFWTLFPTGLILLFWLAAKSRRGEIIIYESWLDAFLTLVISAVPMFIMIEINLPIGIALVILSFGLSCWISIKRNKNISRSLGFAIGIARMLIVYFFLALALLASAAIKAQEKNLEEASYMRRSSERTAKAKNKKLRDAKIDGVIATISITIFVWLMKSFIHSESKKYQK